MGNDSTNGTGNNGTANTGSSQLRFDQTFTAGDNVVVSISNSGAFSGTNTVQGDAVAIINGSQFISSGAFSVGDNFNCELQNTGNDSSLGVGLSNIGQLNAAQMILQTTGTVGKNCTISIHNTGINSAQTTSFPDFIGYLNDQQFFVGNIFGAGENFSLTVSNTGSDTSNGHGGYQVAIINSNSGTTGNQILFQQGCILAGHATISTTNSGTYSGTNTNGGSNVAGMNLQQVAIGDSTMPGSYFFQAGDYFSFGVSNSGIDSSNGTGANTVGDVSEDQTTLFAPAILGTYANITITNSGNFSGHASTSYVDVGSAGGCQLNCIGSFSADANFTLNVSNSGTNTGSGIGGYFVGDLIDGQQVTFQNSLILGNNASITIANSGSNSSNTTNNNQVGSLVGYGKQLLAKNLLLIGDDFLLEITNSGFDDSTGPGGNFVGFMNNDAVDHTASQWHLAEGGTVGGNAQVTLSNTGTYQGSNTTSGNLVAALAGQQFYSVVNFQAGNNFGLTVSNAGIDKASGQNNNGIGTLNGSQVEFGGDCVIGNNALIVLSNSGTNNDPTGTLNNIGAVFGAQMLVNGNFSAGTALNINANNTSINEGSSNNFIGYIASSQLVFSQSCTLNDGSSISAFNSGTVVASQIVFDQGFDIASGKATIQAVNNGTVGSFGIDIEGANAGGNANIVLSNSSLNIGATLPTFTIAGLSGDSTSIVQSQPELIINTNASTQPEFSGVIQNFPATSSTLMITGNGKQILSGNNTMTGLTTIQGGNLVLLGSMVGDILIGPGGTLSGGGSASTVTNMGLISPGQSIGTLSFVNFINDGGTYLVKVNGAGQSSEIIASNMFTIDSGEVLVQSDDGTFLFQHTYTIAQGNTVNSTFTFASSVSPTVIPILSYDPQHVYLFLEADMLAAATTHNQRNVAIELDNIVGPSPSEQILLSEIAILSLPLATAALDSLSGWQYTTDLWAAQVINEEFVNRMYNALRYIIITDPNCCCSDDWAPWMDVGATFTQLEGNSNAHGFRRNGGELTAGIQKTLCCNWTVGLAGSYEHDNLHYRGSGGSGHTDSGLVGIYSLYNASNFYTIADVAYGYSATKLNRSLNIGSLRFRTHGYPKVSQISAYVEEGMNFEASIFEIQPFLGLTGGYNWCKHVNESGGSGWAMHIKEKNCGLAKTRLGLHIAGEPCVPYPLYISGDIAWNLRITGSHAPVSGKFAAFGDDFTISGVSLNSNSIDYALTIARHINSFTLYFQGSGENWNRASNYDALVGLQYTW